MTIRARSFAWFALFFLLASAVVYGQKETSQKYDGHWWLSVMPRELYGFLNGYTDCYVFEYMGPDANLVGSSSTRQNEITDFYTHNPDKSQMLVPDVIKNLPQSKPLEKPQSGGEQAKGKHGFYDGLYWMQEQYLGTVAEERGFVEGYLWCHANLSKNKGGVFSKSPDEYVALITHWYQFDPKTGDVNAERQPAKIADVLYKFRDGATVAEQK